jgi:hypothetical protein
MKKSSAKCEFEVKAKAMGKMKDFQLQMCFCESCYEHRAVWIYLADESQHCTECMSMICAEIEETGSGDPESEFVRIDE